MSICLTPLTAQDRQRFERALLLMGDKATTPLATWAFTPHYIWKDMFSYKWADIKGWWCLFAEYVDGIFMPLQPLGPSATSKSTTDVMPFKDIVGQVMTFMKTQNQQTGVTRIENVPGEFKQCFEGLGFTVRAKDSDYLYRREDIVGLKGDRYKSSRGAYNRFLRMYQPEYMPYEAKHRNECLALFFRWKAQKEGQYSQEASPSNTVARYMLEDAELAHRMILQSPHALGLTGRVLRVDERICGYTFGFERSSQVFCILVEVIDRSIYGAAQFLFREFCRELEGYVLINTMDDSSLPDLARAKLAYHPIELVSNYIVSP